MAQRNVSQNANRKEDLVEPDISNPKTWSLDDPLLWLHEETYRKFFELPSDAPIPGHPAHRVNATNTKKTGAVPKFPRQCTRDHTVKKLPAMEKTLSFIKNARAGTLVGKGKKGVSSELDPRSTASVPASKVATREMLKARLVEKSRSDTLNEMLKMKDPDFDVEEDWWTPYQEHFSAVDSVENDDFALWLAEKDYEMEEKMKKHLVEMKKREEKAILEVEFDEVLVGENRNRRKKVQSSQSTRTLSTRRVVQSRSPSSK